MVWVVVMGRGSRELAMPESSKLPAFSHTSFEERLRGGEGEEGARVLTLTQGRQARGLAETSRLSSICWCSFSTLSSTLDSRQQRSSSSPSAPVWWRSERVGGDEQEVVGRGFPEEEQGGEWKRVEVMIEHAKHCAKKQILWRMVQMGWSVGGRQ